MNVFRHEVEEQMFLLRDTTVRGDPRTRVETRSATLNPVDQNETPGPKGKVEDTIENQDPIGSHVQIETLDASRGSLDRIVNMLNDVARTHHIVLSAASGLRLRRSHCLWQAVQWCPLVMESLEHCWLSAAVPAAGPGSL